MRRIQTPPRRYWGAPPPMGPRRSQARADYFGEWNFNVLPRRGAARPDGRRTYEVRCWMTGICYTIDDELAAIAPVDLRGILARLDAAEASGTGLRQDMEAADGHRSWLRRAALELIHRTGDLPAGTAIDPEDWHLRDLERMRRVVEKAAAHLLFDPAREQP